MPSLFVIRGNDQGTRFELVDPVVRLGRDASASAQLHDSEVSRHHAELRRDEQGNYVISDLNSSNGTYINGRRIRQHTLRSGEQVQVGSTLLLYTGALDPSADRLADIVRIAEAPDEQEASRIVRSVTQKEGSALLDFSADKPENAWLARARGNLQVMYRTALAVSHTLDIDQLLQRIMELIFEWVEADRGCIMLLDPQTKQFTPRVRRARARPGAEETITISRTILDYVVERGEGVLTSDAKQDQRWEPGASIVQAGVREAICVPMQGRYDMVGVIYIDTSTPPEEVLLKGPKNKFTGDHLKLMVAIGHQAALAVEDTRYYSAMVQAERLAAIGQTVAVLSHHIKNILQGIRGGSYLIEMGLNEHDESIVRKGWTIVEKNQNKISALVLDMLTFSKEREPDLAPGHLNCTVADVVELMQASAVERNVQLSYCPDETLPEIVFDAEGIHRAVLNIVTNAIDAAGESDRAGCVTVRTEYRPVERIARIIIEDDGPGIAPEHREHLFNPFFSTKGVRGTGLGLAVSRKIVHEHGGRIDVGDRPGGGCAFVIELPAAPTAPALGTTTVLDL